MLISNKVARTKWCPFVRIDNNNRKHNTITDGFENTEKMYHCIAGDCMGWRQFHLSHMKGGSRRSGNPRLLRLRRQGRTGVTRRLS